MKTKICAIVSFLAVSGLLAAPDTALAQTKLKYHSAFPEATLNLTARWWMDEVEKRTNGKVKFDRIFGGALGKLKSHPMSIKSGSFDLGQVSAVYNPGLFPRSSVTVLPFLTDNILAHAKAAHDLFNSAALAPEFKALNEKYLFNGMWITIEMMSYDPVRKIDDLRKMKIRAHGGSADALKTLGITSYAIPWGELPAAAERRVVDAAIIGAPADAYDFGFGDIFNYWSRLKWYFFPLTLTMNLDTWNKLPADVRKVMEDLNKEMPTRSHELRLPNEMKAEKALIEGGLVKVIKFEEEDKLIAQTSKPVWDKWVAARKAQDIDGQAILDEFLRLVKKYE